MGLKNVCVLGAVMFFLPGVLFFFDLYLKGPAKKVSKRYIAYGTMAVFGLLAVIFSGCLEIYLVR